MGSCAAGFSNCDGSASNGCEASLRTTSDCGACGRACSYPNLNTSCGDGTCTLSGCVSGWGNCDGSLSNGCEVPLNTTANCGACGTSCSFSNAGATCSGGACALGRCNTNYGNCDGSAANGCELFLASTSNCGGCGVRCSGGTPNCRNVGGVGYMCASF